MLEQAPYRSPEATSPACRTCSEKDQIIAVQQQALQARAKEIDHLRGEMLRRTAEDEAQWTWLNREGVKPDYKLLVAQVMRRLGIGFKNPNHERWKEFTEIKIKDLARDNGASEKVIGDYMAFITTPSDQCPDAVLRKKVVPKPRRAQSEDGQWTDTGKTYKQSTYAPPDPLVFTKYFSDPAAVPVPATRPRQQQNTQHKREVRQREQERVTEAEARAETAEAEVRRILAVCPACGCRDIAVRCHACGTITAAADIPDAPTDQQSADQHLDITTADTPLSAPVLTTTRTSKEEGSLSPDSVIHGSADQHLDITVTAEEDGAGEDGDMETARAAAVVHLVNGDHDLACVLARAVNVVLPAVEVAATHTVMQRRETAESAKYKTAHQPLSACLVAQHLVGTTTLGAGLLTSLIDADGPPTCRAVAYDSDKRFGTLVAAARKLAARGLSPLLVRNDAKRASGHLWVFFDRDVDPQAVFATLETWAPMLGTVSEHFPNLGIKGGARLRLPGGCYLPVGSDPVPVQVALGAAEGDLEWVDALDPLAWVLLGGALTPADAVQHAWIPPAERPQPTQKAAPPTLKAVPAPDTSSGGSASDTLTQAVAAFNAAYSVPSLVDVNKGGMFKSPWHEDSTASCKAYEDGHWCDFSRDNKGGDALALWCALKGHWPESAEKPDRIGALVALGRLTDSLRVTRRGDLTRVALHVWRNPGKLDRTKAALKAAFPAAHYNAAEHVWELPAAAYEQACAWRTVTVAVEKARGSA